MSEAPIQTVARILRGIAIPVFTEDALQVEIAKVLTRYGIAFEREVRLDEHDRIDFLVGTVGVEVKIQGSLSEVQRQLHRYAQHDRIESLLLVTTRMRHKPVASSMRGKPVHVVHLIGASL